MKNSLSLSDDEVQKRISSGEHYVIRIKIPRKEEVRLHDIIRGWVVVDSSQMDDKVLFKSDGMPTYHLANVVDDYTMKITHVIRGEEWLPSAPLHVLLYRYLGWEDVMPQFAHLPLLLRPDGNGKLSKRDGDRLGFPVFPLSGKLFDHNSGKEESFSGYREAGYFPEAFINMLALLGWHASGNQEIFSLDELVKEFSLERVSKHGAKFDPEKTKWFNQQYLRTKSDEQLTEAFLPILETKLAVGSMQLADKEYIKKVCSLIKEKASFVNEFWSLGNYFFIEPEKYDAEVIKKRWNEKTKNFMADLAAVYQTATDFSAANAETIFKQTCEKLGTKSGEVMQLFRVCISGVGGGPALFEAAALIGKEKVVNRLEAAIKKIK
jgi:glutamyl-tRNA synthetase